MYMCDKVRISRWLSEHNKMVNYFRELSKIKNELENEKITPDSLVTFVSNHPEVSVYIDLKEDKPLLEWIKIKFELLHYKLKVFEVESYLCWLL